MPTARPAAHLPPPPSPPPGLASAEDYHFYAGCYLWAPGQLAKEIEVGAWVPACASAPMVSSLLDAEDEAETKYLRALDWLEIEPEDPPETVPYTKPGAADEESDELEGDELGVGDPLDGSDDLGAEDLSELGEPSSESSLGGIDSRLLSLSSVSPDFLPLAGEVVRAVRLWVALADESDELSLLSAIDEAEGLLHVVGSAGRREEGEADAAPAEGGAARRATDPWSRLSGAALDALAERVASLCQPSGSVQCAAASPQYVLHAMRLVLLHEGGAHVPMPSADDASADDADGDGAPAAMAAALSLSVPLERIVDNVMQAAEGAQGGAEGGAAGGAGPSQPLSSVQLGLLSALLAERIGLNASLVEAEGSGLLLQVAAADGDESLYMSLQPGAECGRTLHAHDLLAPAGVQRMLAEALPGPRTLEATTLVVHRLSHLQLMGRVALVWSDCFRAAGLSALSTFWEVQQLILQRLESRGGGTDDDEAPRNGLMINLRLPDDMDDGVFAP